MDVQSADARLCWNKAMFFYKITTKMNFEITYYRRPWILRGTDGDAENDKSHAAVAGTRFF